MIGIELGQLLAVIFASAVLAGIVSYFVAWMTVHVAIDDERALQERRRRREAQADWEKTHIPDDPEVTYRRR